MLYLMRQAAICYQKEADEKKQISLKLLSSPNARSGRKTRRTWDRSNHSGFNKDHGCIMTKYDLFIYSFKQEGF